MKQSSNSSGFTIVEVVTTLAVVALFLTFFFQMYLAMESQRIGVARHALASDLAYSNLRKFSVRPSLTVSQTECEAKMDLTAADIATNPKTGLLLGDETNSATPSGYGFLAEPTTITKGLGGNVTQKVVAFAPKGCSGSNLTNNPLKIESTVSYGLNGDKVVHASYLN